MKRVYVTKISLDSYRKLLDLGYMVIFRKPSDDKVKLMHVVRDKSNKVISLKVLH